MTEPHVWLITTSWNFERSKYLLKSNTDFLAHDYFFLNFTFDILIIITLRSRISYAWNKIELKHVKINMENMRKRKKKIVYQKSFHAFVAWQEHMMYSYRCVICFLNKQIYFSIINMNYRSRNQYRTATNQINDVNYYAKISIFCCCCSK